MSAFETGVAQVLYVDATRVTVHCPHCGDEHRHQRAMIGSREILAGCHTGWSRCRTYSIPKQSKKDNR